MGTELSTSATAMRRTSVRSGPISSRCRPVLWSSIGRSSIRWAAVSRPIWGVLRLPGGTELPIADVSKSGDAVLHRIGRHRGTAVPALGQEVEGVLDWDRRYRHMRLHTTQHLLSARLFERKGRRTVRARLDGSSGTLDLEAPALEGSEELADISADLRTQLDRNLPGPDSPGPTGRLRSGPGSPERAGPPPPPCGPGTGRGDRGRGPVPVRRDSPPVDHGGGPVRPRPVRAASRRRYPSPVHAGRGRADHSDRVTPKTATSCQAAWW